MRTFNSQQIIEFHKKGNFEIQQLPDWQQEIVLKAIHKIPELRFQFMVEFEEAIVSKSVKAVFNRTMIKAAEVIACAEKEIKKKKWLSALKFLEFAEDLYPNNVIVMQCFGKYYLYTQNIIKAKDYIEKALTQNPRLNLQKDLGWINLEQKNYPYAISLLMDHLHRQPTDLEGYNLLLRCYYETERYETAMDLAKMLMDAYPDIKCFTNNYFVCNLLQNLPKTINKIIKTNNCHFVAYNKSVYLDIGNSYNREDKLALKSKLIFMDYHFNDFVVGNISLIDKMNREIEFDKAIVKIGREGFLCNDYFIDSDKCSRRHCLIINAKNNTWIYDLNSTSTTLNDTKVESKAVVYERSSVHIGGKEFYLKLDKRRLL